MRGDLEDVGAASTFDLAPRQDANANTGSREWCTQCIDHRSSRQRNLRAAKGDPIGTKTDVLAHDGDAGDHDWEVVTGSPSLGNVVVDTARMEPMRTRPLARVRPSTVASACAVTTPSVTSMPLRLQVRDAETVCSGAEMRRGAPGGRLSLSVQGVLTSRGR